MNNLGEYLKKKQQELDLDRAGELAQIQALLDSWYPGKCRAQKLIDGKLTISTKSSPVANELRFKLEHIQQKFTDVTKVIIR